MQTSPTTRMGVQAPVNRQPDPKVPALLQRRPDPTKPWPEGLPRVKK